LLIAPIPKLQVAKMTSRASSQILFAMQPSALPAWASPSPRRVYWLARIRSSAEPPTKNATIPNRGHVNQLRIPITSAQTAPASIGAASGTNGPEARWLGCGKLGRGGSAGGWGAPGGSSEGPSCTQALSTRADAGDHELRSSIVISKYTGYAYEYRTPCETCDIHRPGEFVWPVVRD